MPTLVFVQQSQNEISVAEGEHVWLAPLPGTNYGSIHVNLAGKESRLDLSFGLSKHVSLTLSDDSSYDYIFNRDTGRVDIHTQGASREMITSLAVDKDGKTLTNVRIDSGDFTNIKVNPDLTIASNTLPVAPDDSTPPKELRDAANLLSNTIDGVDEHSFLATHDRIVQSLDSGYYWNVDAITYSFNETLPPEYRGSDRTGWEPIPATLRPIIHTIMEQTDALIALDISYAAQTEGDIRFNTLEMPKNIAGWAYYPGDGIGGDVFLSADIGNEQNHNSAEPYGFGRSTITHETGHALGLEHSFEGRVRLSTDMDHTTHTIMSYTAFKHFVPVFKWTQEGGRSAVDVELEQIFADHFMVFDIAALQAFYEPNLNSRQQDDVYEFTTEPFYKTIWDAGGNDTLDFSKTEYKNVIDLRPGSYSNVNYRTIDEQIATQQEIYSTALGTNNFDDFVQRIYQDHQNDIYTGEKALGIAYGVIIENVIGGPAGNTITANHVDNVLRGGAGDDVFILGAGGFDRVDGVAGFNIVRLPDIFMDDIQSQQQEDDSWLVVAENFAAELRNIDKIYFEAGDLWLA